MDTRGIIVLILAGGIMSVLILAVAGTAIAGRNFSEIGSQTLSTILGMIVGVISAYVAGVIQPPVERPRRRPVEEVEPGVDVAPGAVPPSDRGDTTTTKDSPHETGTH